MASFAWQTWNSGPFSIERKPGKVDGVLILAFHGPCTLRDAYSNLDPKKMNEIMSLDAGAGEETITKCIIDLAGCPYMDSSGLGIVVTHYVRCQRKNIKMVVCNLSHRVREVVEITRVNTVFPIVDTMEAAEAL